jgi:hypothetical protein
MQRDKDVCRYFARICVPCAVVVGNQLERS